MPPPEQRSFDTATEVPTSIDMSQLIDHAKATSQPTDRAFDFDGDRLREECGVFGIFGHPDAAAITALGLHALQHRGQEAAGIVSFDGKRFHSERRMGLVGDNFSRREVIDRLPGIVGHRPCALFDHRRDHPAQRPAAVRRARRRRLRHRPQRQPDQRPRRCAASSCTKAR